MAKSGKFVSYIRVSTAKQGMSGLGLEAQQEAVRGWLNGGKWSLEGEFVEVESGKRSDRPKLAEALRLCRQTGSTLIIAKLDRLARNVAFISALMESGVDFVAVDMPEANKLLVHLMAAFAEHEADAISARTKAALAAAKARGVVLGGNRGKLDQVRAKAVENAAKAHKHRADKRAQEIGPIAVELSTAGLSLRAIAGEFERRGFKTERGAKWSAQSISNLLVRSGAA